MRRSSVLAVAAVLSASLLATANAAPAGKGAAPRNSGLANAKKVMQARLDREKKMATVRKQAQAKKHLAPQGQ